jgi:abl interactor 2
MIRLLRPATDSTCCPQKIGSIDTSSKTNVLKSTVKSPPAHQTPFVPPAFAPKKNAFSPPPKHEPEPEPEPEEEEQAQGEWAEALYDYHSAVSYFLCSMVFLFMFDRLDQEPGDLPIREGQQVWVTDRTSTDW